MVEGTRRTSFTRRATTALQSPDYPPQNSATLLDTAIFQSKRQSTDRSLIVNSSPPTYSLRHSSLESGQDAPQTDHDNARPASSGEATPEVDSTEYKFTHARREHTVKPLESDGPPDLSKVSEPSRSLVYPFDRPAPPGHVAVLDRREAIVMSRPRAGRSATGRDTRDGDMETDLLNRVIDAVKKAKEYSDNEARIGQQIVELEADIKAKGGKCCSRLLRASVDA